MHISGFTFARNAQVLDYPLREAILSVLPVVDQMVVVVADGDPEDDTLGMVRGLQDSRIEVVEASWDGERGALAYSDLTNLALDRCTGDWCLYVQADEVLHEDDLDPLRERFQALLGDERVQGLLFDYLHFFGDYRHLQTGHGWYQQEIRAIRNGRGIRSVRDAQSFRYSDQARISVARARARVFHYGWVRHPRYMEAKVRAFWRHRGRSLEMDGFDYGPLGRLAVFRGTHPAVMGDRMRAMDWGHLLRESDPPGLRRDFLHKDERLKYRVLSAFTRVTGIDLNHTNHGRVLKV